jgi:hypothetical protein
LSFDNKSIMVIQEMAPAALIRTDTTRGNDMSEAARFLGGCAIIDGPSMEPYMRDPIINNFL